ncbi:MAG: N-acetylneuraminate synthase family protein [Microscillaceae bacterium]|nr:N-acetylneuraminate synthase family protein [Microscillaceae bacterium]
MNQTSMHKIKDIARERGVYFIAEIGQNHQGQLDIAKKMVDSLVGTGVAAIKTAKRDIDTCLSEEQKNMIYDNPNSFGRTYYEHRKALELSKDDFIELKNYTEAAGFEFFSSFTDENSLDFLVEIGVRYLKIASQRLADYELMKKTAAKGLPMIISTGMSNIEDVDKIIEIFANNEKYLLQCSSIYPCPESELHLNVMKTYQERYKGKIVGVGFSGHHAGIAPDIAAYMLGAEIIERHYTLSRAWKGTDHAASLEKRGIEYILKYIAQVKDSLGSFEKVVLEGEKPAMKKLRADLHSPNS